MKKSFPGVSAARISPPRISHTPLIAIWVLSMLMSAGECATGGQTDCVSGDESHLISRIAKLQEAIQANDVASWYSLSSPNSLFGRRLSFEEFKRTHDDDPYGRLEGWGLRQAELEKFCGSANVSRRDGTPVCRSALLIGLSFDNHERAHVVEVWERADGEWYWSSTGGQEACRVPH